MSGLTRRGIAIAAVVAIADQASKILVTQWLDQVGTGVPVAPFFNLVYVLNRGASFGLFSSDSPAVPWLLSGFTVAVVAGLVVWMARTVDRWLGIALALIIGGAVGNLIDRLAYGAVVDFLDFHVAGLHWPAFNVADSAITVGVAMVLYESLIGHRSGRTVG